MDQEIASRRNSRAVKPLSHALAGCLLQVRVAEGESGMGKFSKHIRES